MFIISAGSKVGLYADVCFFVSPQQVECKSSPKESKEAAVDLLGLGKSSTFHQPTIKHSTDGEITCQTPPPPRCVTYENETHLADGRNHITLDLIFAIISGSVMCVITRWKDPFRCWTETLSTVSELIHEGSFRQPACDVNPASNYLTVRSNVSL